MEEFNIRLSSIKLENFKNVRMGKIEMPSSLKQERSSADILGIYGQNGSGKTAVIEAFEIIDSLLSGRSLPTTSKDFINVDASSSIIEITFSYFSKDDNKKGEIIYTLSFSKEREEAFIEKESLDLKERKEDGSGYRKLRNLITYNGRTFEIRPVSFFKKITKNNKERELNLLVASRMARKNTQSFIFSPECAYPILSSLEDDEVLSFVIRKLSNYAQTSLVVISSREFGYDSSFRLPITFKNKKDGKERLIMLDIGKPDILKLEDARMLKHMIGEMNTVLSTIIPHLNLSLYEAGEELTKDGSKGIRVELVSNKNGKAIPIRYESEGIIKIISIMNLLLCVYNDENTCLVIDEFDASIFEYLLGELMKVFSTGAKGQMIFTSHNLRVLEMIDKDSIVFSTSNPDNRYIRFNNIRESNNLRDVYIRSLLLGGTKENIYEETDTYEIGRSLRRAWRSRNEEGEQ